MLKIIFYLFLFLIVSFGCLFAWAYFKVVDLPELNIPDSISQEDKVKIIDAWFEEIHAMKKFNGIILYAKEGKPILMKGYGFTDYTQKEKLTTKSSMRLASVSKQFTAAGVMRCQELGLLDFDDLVSKYFSGFPYEEVSIRSMLNAASGIPVEYFDLAEAHKSEIVDILSTQKAAELIIKYPSEKSKKPYTAYEYLNTNYILLAAIVEKVSGKSFESFMKSELFEPLGMSNTRVWNLLSEDSTFENKTGSYDSFLKTPEELKPDFMDGVAGDGAVFSSAEDLLIWDNFWYGNDQISPEIMEEAFIKPKLNDGSESDYGFGWVVTEKGMWHNGSWLGARSYFERNPSKKTCFAIIDNSSTLVIDEIVAEFGKKVLDKD